MELIILQKRFMTRVGPSPYQRKGQFRVRKWVGGKRRQERTRMLHCFQAHFDRQSAQGQQTKAELVYQYLTGPRFKLRVQAIVEGFTEMHDDLQRERKAITKQWAKREMEIMRVLESTVGLYGDLQGIAGQSLQEIEGLGLKMLEG